MTPDYSKWALACLAKQLSKEFPSLDNRFSTYCGYLCRMEDIEESIQSESSPMMFSGQWLLDGMFMSWSRRKEGENHPIYQELQRRLKEDQEKRGRLKT